MVTILPKEEGYSEIGERFGTGFVKGYQDRSDDMAIQKAVQDLGPNASARDIINAVTGAKTYGNESKQKFFKNIMGAEKIDLAQKQAKTQQDLATAKNTIANAKAAEQTNKPIEDRKNAKGIVNQLNIPDEQKEALGEVLTPAQAGDLLKQQLKPANFDKMSPFEKKVAEKQADEYVKLSETIPELEDVLATIEQARQLSKEIGYIGTGFSAVGLSQKGKELEGITFPLIKPILKLLAPSGQIAKEKLLRAENKYAIYGSDAPWLREAKLNALKSFTRQTLARANKRKQLIEENNGIVPKGVIEKFDRESETIADAMLDYDLVGEEANVPGLPPAGEYKGDEIESSDGTTYYSDGTRWLKK